MALQIHVAETRQELGRAAALHAAASIRRLAESADDVAVVFATGASQLETLRTLVQLPDVPWEKVTGFHLDEYLGLDASHPASFRYYLRKELAERVPFKQFYFLEGDAADIAATCREYARMLRQHSPQLCLLGIGENGHLAFNDPPVADFHDPEDVKVVELDVACREQQVKEGWFPSFDRVPRRAISLTIPAILRIPELILSVPGERKAAAVRRTLHDEISTSCPATILREHANAHLYLDRASAAEASL